MVKKTLYIVRHGQTEFNKLGIIQGRGVNTDLNDEGRRQARLFFEAYKNVPFDKAYISALKRTQQSIQPFIDGGLNFEKLSGLDELAWGVHEGQLPTTENKAAFLQIMRDWLDSKLDSKFEGGESPNEVEIRQREALEVIMSHPEEKTVLICMHGRAMRLLLCILTGKPLSEMDTFPHQNLVLYKVVYNGEKFEIVDFNNAEHLNNPERALLVKKIRISAVSYTNTKPFIYGLQHTGFVDKIELSLDMPSDCAQKLIDDVVDIGLIPVAATLNIPNWNIVSDYCIGAVGAVNSVFIFSNCEVRDIKYLQLDPESRSSNNLARVLLKNFWKVCPQLIKQAPDYSFSTEENTAFIQIGDRTFGKKDQYKYVYDLAEEWQNFTGLPFMFAGWIANKPIPKEFMDEFNAALKYGLDHREDLFKELPMREDFDLVDYLMVKIDYELTEEKKKALFMFLDFIKQLED